MGDQLKQGMCAFFAESNARQLLEEIDKEEAEKEKAKEKEKEREREKMLEKAKERAREKERNKERENQQKDILKDLKEKKPDSERTIILSSNSDLKASFTKSTTDTESHVSPALKLSETSSASY